MGDEENGELKSANNVLDELIQTCYKKILEEIKEKPKLGDLLKMIELKRKLSPADADQKKFWKELDKIRKEVLSDKKNQNTENNKPKKK